MPKRCSRRRARSRDISIAEAAIARHEVKPATVGRFGRAAIKRSAAILERIVDDGIRRVVFDVKSTEFRCDSDGFDPAMHRRRLIRAHFNANSRPAFNDSAREQAGLTR